MKTSPVLGVFLAGLVLGVGIGGCRPHNTLAPPPPPEVTVAYPLQKKVADTVEFTGTTRSTARVDVRARVDGYLKEIKFEDGESVEKDQVLFILEQQPYTIELQMATALRDKAEAGMQLQKLEFERAESLLSRKTITQAEFDIQQAELATANAEFRAAEAAVATADLNLGYTVVTAPISGRIGRHLVDVGNLVQSEATQLATIESIDPIHAYFNVSETELLKFMEMLRENKLPDPDANPPTLYLGLSNEVGFPHQGQLDFRELGVDPGTGTVMRRGVFENDDHKLIPGLFVRIRAYLGEPRTRLLVDERAIGADQVGDYLLVVGDEEVVRKASVRLGMRTGGMRVVEDGIAATDRVVINGLQFAREGAKVTIKQDSILPMEDTSENLPEALKTSDADDDATGSPPPRSVEEPRPADEAQTPADAAPADSATPPPQDETTPPTS